jgi:hypothetical protein
MVEPNADERERAMDCPTSTTQVPGISEQQRRFLLGQAMDLNCLTWIVHWWLQKSSAWPQVWLAIWASMSSGWPWNHLTWSNRLARWLGASRPPQFIHGIYGVEREVFRKTRLKILRIMDRVASWCIPRWIWRSMLKDVFRRTHSLPDGRNLEVEPSRARALWYGWTGGG